MCPPALPMMFVSLKLSNTKDINNNDGCFVLLGLDAPPSPKELREAGVSTAPVAANKHCPAATTGASQPPEDNFCSIPCSSAAPSQ